MSMHLEGPWLSTTGKKKGKQKFRSAAEAAKARELENSWQELQKKWSVTAAEKKKKQALAAPVWKEPTPLWRGANEPKIPSRSEWTTGAVTTKPAQQYTGTKILGIGTMHKSNAVPIFSDDEAKEISSMRR